MTPQQFENCITAIAYLKNIDKELTKINGSHLFDVFPLDTEKKEYGIWDMNSWGESVYSEGLLYDIEVCDSDHLEASKKWLNEHECKTSGCALGWISFSGLIPDLSRNKFAFYFQGKLKSAIEISYDVFGLRDFDHKTLFESNMTASPMDVALKWEGILENYDV